MNSAFAGPTVLFALPVGRLVDRFNRRNLLAAIVMLWSTATARPEASR